MDYQLLIVGGLAQLSLRQEYENPSPHFLEFEYFFPIEPNACVTSFKATFADQEIVGIVKEKEEAKAEYQAAKEQGRQVAFGEVCAESKDVMRLQIGNVPPMTRVTILMVCSYPLEASLNTFWRLSVQSHVWPRYLNDPRSKITGSTSAQFSWTFKLELRASAKIVSCSSPTHRLAEFSRN